MPRVLLSALIAIAAVLWGLLLLATGQDIELPFFRPFTVVVTAVSLLIAAFDRWAWRLAWVGRLLSCPSLRGTWAGTLVPRSARGKNRKAGRPIQCYVVIAQTFSSLHMRLFTAESASSSVTARILREPSGRFLLVTVYRNEPRIAARSRSPVHYGGTLLDIEGDSLGRLRGHYWTDRDTKGELELTRLSRQRVRSFEAAERLRAR